MRATAALGRSDRTKERHFCLDEWLQENLGEIRKCLKRVNRMYNDRQGKIEKHGGLKLAW